jgi:hypothetical protein
MTQLVIFHHHHHIWELRYSLDSGWMWSMHKISTLIHQQPQCIYFEKTLKFVLLQRSIKASPLSVLPHVHGGKAACAKLGKSCKMQERDPTHRKQMQLCVLYLYSCTGRQCQRKYRPSITTREKKKRQPLKTTACLQNLSQIDSPTICKTN